MKLKSQLVKKLKAGAKFWVLTQYTLLTKADLFVLFPKVTHKRLWILCTLIQMEKIRIPDLLAVVKVKET